MDGGGAFNIRTVEDVFRDFKGRRAGMIRALTTDVHEFSRLCNPEKDNLCLYGHPDEHWKVTLPTEEVPTELPEPVLGINFARDGMIEKDWLSLVAVHSDAWLLSVAFYFGARERLFNKVNDLPIIFEVVAGFSENQSKAKSSVSNNSSNRVKSNSKESRAKLLKVEPEEEYEEEEEVEEEDPTKTECGVCRESYATGEFWIGCDICEDWFHGKCVKITPAKAEHIKQYKCPKCSNKRDRS